MCACSSIVIVVLGLLWAPSARSIDGPIPADYALPGLAVLSSPTQPLACAGLHLSPSLIVTTASCARDHAPLEWAMYPSEDGDELQPKRSFTLFMESRERLRIRRVEVHSAYSDKDTSDAVATDIALVHLSTLRSSKPRHLSPSQPDVDLPTQQQFYDQDSLLAIDLAKEQGFLMHPAVYVDNSFCGLGARQSKHKEQAMCLVPIFANTTSGDTRIVETSDTTWMFLLRRNMLERKVWLLGLGHSRRLVNGVYRSFSWVPAALPQVYEKLTQHPNGSGSSSPAPSATAAPTPVPTVPKLPSKPPTIAPHHVPASTYPSPSPSKSPPVQPKSHIPTSPPQASSTSKPPPPPPQASPSPTTYRPPTVRPPPTTPSSPAPTSRSPGRPPQPTWLP
ncbi:hypothetical protein PINS_up005555 [Pythium insidiosum]|nr:hypothetical protein PINS_up005555 [Pythium insidiosum]